MRNPLFETLTETRSWCKSIQFEKTFTLNRMDYLCQIDCSIRFWTDDRFPELDRLWPVTATGVTGHEVFYKPTLTALHSIVTQWLKDDCCEYVVELIERKKQL